MNCSQPHGSVPLLPMVLLLAGSSDMCFLIIRDVVDKQFDYNRILANRINRDIAGFVFGLYTNRVIYYQGNTDDSLVMQCYATFKLARGISVPSLDIGSLSLCFLLFANCMILGRRVSSKLQMHFLL
jgi:hypothetical protein